MRINNEINARQLARAFYSFCETVFLDQRHIYNKQHVGKTRLHFFFYHSIRMLGPVLVYHNAFQNK